MTEESRIHIREEWVNRSENYHCGDSGVYETWASQSEKGKLFRSLQNEHGRCTGKIYIDTKSGETLHIGWIFEKRVRYNDSSETFLLETWITIHYKQPTRTIKYHYINL